MPDNTLILEDNAFGTLSAGITALAASLTLTSGQGARFPAVASGQALYMCILSESNVLEEVICTAHTANSDTFTITRAANGTTALAWAAGDRVEARLSSEALERIKQEALLHTVITTTDTGQSYLGTMTPAGLAYITGKLYPLTLTVSNTGTAPTVNLNGLGAVVVKRDDGSALAAGDMPNKGLYHYNGTNLIILNRLNSAASQAQMEAAASSSVFLTPANAHYHPAIPKVLCMADPAGAIVVSFNMTSVTDTGTGDITFTFATDFSSANYEAFINALADSGDTLNRIVYTTDQAAGSIRGFRANTAGTAVDPLNWFLSAFGDQA